MNAKKAVKVFGKRLVGQKVRTEKYGDWKGGIAKVLKLYPDKHAKDIVMQVRMGKEEIGVLDHENIEIV